MRWRRRSLVDLLAEHIAAAGPVDGDLVDELVIVLGRDEVEQLNTAIIHTQLVEQSENAEELSGL
jgi:hypothetical protein